MNKVIVFSTLSAGLLSFGLAFATPKEAVDQVRGNADQMLLILKKANGANDLSVRKEAENYASPYFDFDLMTRLAVGAPWNRASAEQKQALVKEHRAMLVRTYARQMLMYKDAKVTVHSNPAVKNGGKLLGNRQIVEVKATIVPVGKQPVQAVFSTYQNGSRYSVYNVAFEGVFDLVRSQRDQFAPVLKAKGIDGLIADLKAKNSGK